MHGLGGSAPRAMHLAVSSDEALQEPLPTDRRLREPSYGLPPGARWEAEPGLSSTWSTTCCNSSASRSTGPTDLARPPGAQRVCDPRRLAKPLGVAAPSLPEHKPPAPPQVPPPLAPSGSATRVAWQSPSDSPPPLCHSETLPLLPPLPPPWLPAGLRPAPPGKALVVGADPGRAKTAARSGPIHPWLPT